MTVFYYSSLVTFFLTISVIFFCSPKMQIYPHTSPLYPVIVDDSGHEKAVATKSRNSHLVSAVILSFSFYHLYIGYKNSKMTDD